MEKYTEVLLERVKNRAAWEMLSRQYLKGLAYAEPEGQVEIDVGSMQRFREGMARRSVMLEEVLKGRALCRKEKCLLNEEQYLKCLANAQPDGQVEPDLGPGKDPGNGTQVINTACSLPLSRTTANVHAAELAHRRHCLKELNELRVLPHHIPVPVTGHLQTFAQVSVLHSEHRLARPHCSNTALQEAVPMVMRSGSFTIT